MSRTRNIIVSLIIVIIASICSVILVRCQIKKTFSKAGMTITLTTKFNEYEEENFTVYYRKNDASVGGIKVTFDDLGTSSYTTEEFAWELISRGEYDSYTKDEGNYVSYVFYNSNGEEQLYNYCACFKTDDSYWVFRFTCLARKESKLKKDFEKWANSIVFD